jgi:hypothetical protein
MRSNTGSANLEALGLRRNGPPLVVLKSIREPCNPPHHLRERIALGGMGVPCGAVPATATRQQLIGLPNGES